MKLQKRGYSLEIDEANGLITALYDQSDSPAFNLVNDRKKFLSLSYTLLSDDITKGKKPHSTPYVSREAIFPSPVSNFGFENPDLNAALRYEFSDDYFIAGANGENPEISEFGLNLPFNFLGRKGYSYEGQLLVSTPYTSGDGEYMYWLLTRPNGKYVLITSLTRNDGWKIDYSPYIAGHFIQNLKLLKHFDRAYGVKPSSGLNIKLRFDFPKSVEDIPALLSEIYARPVAYYPVSSAKTGSSLPVYARGDCDGFAVKSPGGNEIRLKAADGKAAVSLLEYGVYTVTPYYNGVSGLDCKLFAFGDYIEMFRKSTALIPAGLPPYHCDENLCEGGVWAWSMCLAQRIAKNSDPEIDAALEAALANHLDKVMAKDPALYTERCTILPVPQEHLPAYNVYQSNRIQEQFFGVSYLMEAFLHYDDEQYLEFAVSAMLCLIKNYCADDGMLWRTSPIGSDHIEDYSTVGCLVIPIIDLANLLRAKRDPRYKLFADCAEKVADYVVRRGLNFPTEGGVSDETEAEMEDGSISCSALTAVYACYYLKHKPEYLEFAKKILDLHDAWSMYTPDPRLYRSSLRWWETCWEGDADGPAICGGHAWTLWRGEAEFYYGLLAADTARLLDSYNAYMTNLSKVEEDGTSYACFQPDYITGGNDYLGGHGRSNEDSAEITFRIVHGFPDKTDVSLSRYLWVRMRDTWMKTAALLDFNGFNGALNGSVTRDGGRLVLESTLEDFHCLYIDGITGPLTIKTGKNLMIITRRKVKIDDLYNPSQDGLRTYATPQNGKIEVEIV